MNKSKCYTCLLIKITTTASYMSDYFHQIKNKIGCFLKLDENSPVTPNGNVEGRRKSNNKIAKLLLLLGGVNSVSDCATLNKKKKKKESRETE